MTAPLPSPSPADRDFRRLFAGFDRDVDPPAELATRLRLRVLAEAELDAPVRPLPAPARAEDVAPGVPPGALARLAPAAPYPAPEAAARPTVPSALLPPPASLVRRRQPRWLAAAGVAAGLVLLLGAAAVALRLAGREEPGTPAKGSSVVAPTPAGGVQEPALAWERSDPELQGAGGITTDDALVVRVVQDEDRGGFLWWETYDYTYYLQALDRRTGEERWLTSVEGFGDPLLAGDVVLFTGYMTQRGDAISLTAYDAATGGERWRTELPTPPAWIGDAPVRDGLAYLATPEGQILAVRLADGGQAWAARVGDPPAEGAVAYVSPSSLVLEGDRLLALDPSAGVVELDAATGATLATRPPAAELPAVSYQAWLLATEDRLVTVVSGTEDTTGEGAPPDSTVTRLAAVDRATGVEAWSTELAGNIAVVEEVDGRLLVWSYEESWSESDQPPTVAGVIRALDATTGAELWSAPRAGDPSVPGGAYPMVSFDRAVTSDGQLLYGEATGEVVALDVATGAELWRYRVGASLATTPIVTGGLALASDAPGSLVAVAIPARPDVATPDAGRPDAGRPDAATPTR